MGSNRTHKFFRLSPQATTHLELLAEATGSSQTAIVEQALTAYRNLLEAGHLDPPSDTPTPTPEQPAEASSEPTSKTQRAPAPDAGGQAHGTTYTTHDGDYHFSFPVAKIPKHGSDPCPCGSGKRFNGCHNKDFRRAIKAGLTTRD